MSPVAPAAASAPPVRVLLCDDSTAVRAALARLLRAEPDMRVVGEAGDGRQALARIAALPPGERPEIVLLDLEMPVMDGMTLLPHLMRLPAPRPSVIVSGALTQRGAAAAMAALRAGAVDYVPKPSAARGGLRDDAFRGELLAKLRGWAKMGRGRPAGPRPALPVGTRPVASPPPVGGPRLAAAPPRVVAVGSSTGGPQALATLVRSLGPPGSVTVPMLIVQHMPAGFTAMLADHLARLGGPSCTEARDGEALRPGHILVAPGDRHMLVEAGPREALHIRLSDAPPENFCRPAVDPLLRSLVRVCGGRVLAAILTGMGHDGLAGCRDVASAGGTVLAQDEASSVVWGMPGAVARAGLARAQLPPDALAARILEALRGSSGAAPRLRAGLGDAA